MEEEKQPSDYFVDSNVEERMAQLSDAEMLQLLRNLEQTEYWPAILRYNQQRLTQSQSALFTGDPVKDPTSMSRHQGIMLGLSDLQNAIIMLVQNQQSEAQEEEKSKSKKKKD